MNENDVAVMLQRTIEMKEMVLNYSNFLHHKMESINVALNFYRSAGLPGEVAKSIRIENENDIKVINRLCLIMQTEHVEYLDKMIAGFNRILNEQ